MNIEINKKYDFKKLIEVYNAIEKIKNDNKDEKLKQSINIVSNFLNGLVEDEKPTVVGKTIYLKQDKTENKDLRIPDFYKKIYC